MRITNLKDLDNKHSNPFNQQWVGEITDNADPEQSSRVRVKIPGLTDGLPPTKLPLYKIDSPNSQMMGTSIPVVGTRVIIEFLGDSIYSGVVKSILPAKPPKN